jgi:deoxyribodipyrimidine photolyase-related protein
MSNIVRLVLGDQLNPHHSWFTKVDPTVTYTFIESKGEGSYAPHHIQKVVGIFHSMRTFASRLESEGHKVKYHKILDSREIELIDILHSACVKIGAHELQFMEPDEWRVRKNLQSLELRGYQVSFVSTEHFISDPEEFKETFNGKKSFLMESYYRKLRKRTGILMEGGAPTGGKWNYDAQNRKKLPKNHAVSPPYVPSSNVEEVYKEVQQAGLPIIGTLRDPKHFYWPTNSEQALNIFKHWLEHCFQFFGDFQDAMTISDWALYHSRISFALNTKMIDPMTICRMAEEYYRNNEHIPLNAAEGFIRQILGWREFMRGVYWTRMPEFGQENYFNHKAKLPKWFWSGETKMKCLSHSIQQSLDHAYAHHIQRLMVTGNFALLAGINPDEVDLWYLGIYIDAFEWVEITNTRGMSQYADGGWIATKPYVASANYMKKMGDYCQNCSYNEKTKTDSDSCPFNSLYWNFFERHRDLLGNNFRLGMVYRTFDKMDTKVKEAIRQRASYVLEHLDDL